MGLFDDDLLPAFTQKPIADAIIASARSDWRPEPPPCLDGIDDIYLDLETDGLAATPTSLGGIGICLPDGRTQYLPVRHRGGNNLDEAVVKEWAKKELRGKRIKNHTMKFDNHHLYKWGVDLEEQGCSLADVAFDCALLDDHRPAHTMSQAAMCVDFLPETERKVTIVNGINLDPARMMEYPADVVAVRCEGDVRQVRLLDAVFKPQIIAQGLSKVQHVENDCIYAVCEMERNGIPMDVPLLHQWHREVETKANALLFDIAAEVGFVCSPDSNKDLIRVFEKFGLPLVLSKSKDGKTGAPTFTDDVLKRYDHPSVKKIQAARKFLSLKSKLQEYRNAVSADGMLYYHLHQLISEDGGTITGRFSASDINIQQVMKTKKQIAAFGSAEFLIRQLFLPPPGQLFCSADGRQIEYRIFAHYANSARINAAFDADPLTNFHQLIFAMLSPHNAKLIYEDVKNINFMRIYGGGQIKLALMMGYINQQEADELQAERDEWRKVGNHSLPKQPKLDSMSAVDAIYNKELPEVKPLLEKAKRLAENRGFVRTMLGRRGRFPGHHKRWSYKAFNTVGQGGGADIMKIKLIDLHRMRKHTGFTMRATVHDQVIGDIPDQHAATRVGALLDVQAFKTRIPILWETKTGNNWKECD